MYSCCTYQITITCNLYLSPHPWGIYIERMAGGYSPRQNIHLYSGWPRVRGGAGAGPQGRQRAVGRRQLGPGCAHRCRQGPFLPTANCFCTPPIFFCVPYCRNLSQMLLLLVCNMCLWPQSVTRLVSSTGIFCRQVIYWSTRDLKGIPGSDQLRICLTGYRRNDREDIMVKSV
jgi:hypothetical protein